MGSAFAPSAANLFMDSFEQHHIFDPNINPFYRHIVKYCRFIYIFCKYADVESYDVFLE